MNAVVSTQIYTDKPSFCYMVSPNEQYVANYLYNWRLVVTHLGNKQSWDVIIPILERFTLSDTHLVAGSQSGLVRVFNIKNGKELEELNGHHDRITHLLFTDDKQHLITCSADATVIVWNMKTADKVYTFVPDDGAVVFAATSGPFLVTLGEKNCVLWNVTTGRKIHDVYVGQSISNITISDDGTRIALINDGLLLFWEPGSGHITRTNISVSSYSLRCMKFDKTGKRLFFLYNFKWLRVYDIASDKYLLSKAFTVEVDTMRFVSSDKLVLHGPKFRTYIKLIDLGLSMYAMHRILGDGDRRFLYGARKLLLTPENGGRIG